MNLLGKSDIQLIALACNNLAIREREVARPHSLYIRLLEDLTIEIERLHQARRSAHAFAAHLEREAAKP